MYKIISGIFSLDSRMGSVGYSLAGLTQVYADFQTKHQRRLAQLDQQISELSGEILNETDSALKRVYQEEHDQAIADRNTFVKEAECVLSRLDQARDRIESVNQGIMDRIRQFALNKTMMEALFLESLRSQIEAARVLCSQASERKLQLDQAKDQAIGDIELEFREKRDDLDDDLQTELVKIQSRLTQEAKNAAKAISDLASDSQKTIWQMEIDLYTRRDNLKAKHNAEMEKHFKVVLDHQNELHDQLSVAAKKLKGGGTVKSIPPEFTYDENGFAKIVPGSFEVEGKGIADPSFWELFAAALLSAVLIAAGIAAIVFSFGGAMPLVAAVGLGAAAGAGLGGGISGLSYTIKGGINGDFQWSEFGKTVGVGIASGAVSGAVTAGVGSALMGPGSIVIEKIGVMGLAGMLGSTSGKVVANLITGTPVYEGLLSAAVVGALGGMAGASGAGLAQHLKLDHWGQTGFGFFSGSITSVGSRALGALIDGTPLNMEMLVEAGVTGGILGAISGYMNARQQRQGQIEELNKNRAAARQFLQAKADKDQVRILVKETDGEWTTIDPKTGTAQQTVRIQLENPKNGQMIGHVQPLDKDGHIIELPPVPDTDQYCMDRAYLTAKEGRAPSLPEVIAERRATIDQIRPELENMMKPLFSDMQNEAKFGASRFGASSEQIHERIAEQQDFWANSAERIGLAFKGLQRGTDLIDRLYWGLDGLLGGATMALDDTLTQVNTHHWLSNVRPKFEQVYGPLPPMLAESVESLHHFEIQYMQQKMTQDGYIPHHWNAPVQFLDAKISPPPSDILSNVHQWQDRLYRQISPSQ